MKKVLVILALTVAASTAFAQTGAVYSLNVVGFQKVAVQPTGMSMPGVPFEADSYELNDLIGDQLTAAKNQSGADKIFAWDAQSQAYKKYFLRTTVGNKWVSYEDPDNPTTNAFVYPESGFWVVAVATSTQEVVLVGDVANASAVTNALVAGLNMISYPYSTPRGINDLDLTTGTAAKNQSGADQIWAWDGSQQQYVKFFYRSTVGNKWVAYLDPDVPATNIVSPAEGMWYNARSPFTWIAARPYTLD